MQRLGALYELAGRVPTSDIAIVRVQDSCGQKLTSTIRDVRTRLEESPELWEELFSALRLLRWEWVSGPGNDPASSERFENLSRTRSEVEGLRPRVGDIANMLLSRVTVLCDRLEGSGEPPVAAEMRQLILEIGEESCTVLVANERQILQVALWLQRSGLSPNVVTKRGLRDLELKSQIYIWGSPRLFGHSLTTAPRAEQLTYVFPAWIFDNALPRSPIAEFSVGGISPIAREFGVGQPDRDAQGTEDVDDVAPTPEWPEQSKSAPDPEDVECRNLLLSGGYSMMVDVEGERIRTIDLVSTDRSKLGHKAVSHLEVGDFIVARTGGTNTSALYGLTLEELGKDAPSVLEVQQSWKGPLQDRIESRGSHRVVRELRDLGVSAYRRALAWQLSAVARPQADQDFVLLLRWLSMPDGACFEASAKFRRARGRAVFRVTRSLETSLAAIDVDELERTGWRELKSELPGFAGIMACRILAISPNSYWIDHQKTRIARTEAVPMWLE